MLAEDDEVTTRKPVRRFVLAALVLAGLVAAGYYYWFRTPPPAPPSAVELEAFTERAQAESSAPTHPVRADAEQAPDTEPLPPLDASDDALAARAADLIGRSALERLFRLDNLVRRVVVTIHNLSAPQVPTRYSLGRSVEGRFAVVEDGDLFFLDEKNYERYEPYVTLVQALDTENLVAAYLHFYPLFQEEYENIVDPNGYFNDRVVAVIDDLLATPEVDGRVRLIRPRVMYEFADPDLEALSAGQKILIRMGPENAAIIKAKLREIRKALTARAETSR